MSTFWTASLRPCSLGLALTFVSFLALELWFGSLYTSTMYLRLVQQQRNAQTVLTQFQEHPDAWQRVPKILTESPNAQTKFIALQVSHSAYHSIQALGPSNKYL